MFYVFGSCLFLCVLFFSVSWLFRKLKGVEENPISDNNSPKRLKRAEGKAMSDSNAPQIKYDVFVSFRGEIRDGFLSHLVEAFKTNQINAFVDNRLEKGKDIGPSLVEAIEASSISLIIFSPHYASSRWCLQELVKILECRENLRQTVIPVFYKVKPAHVGHQSSQSYKNAFAKHQRRKETHIQIWRNALETTAKISGLESSNMNDAELVEEIVHLVQTKLVKPAINSKGRVGIDEKIAILKSWIKEEPNHTRVIGIWGMGGLGKTTLAEEVFHKLRCDYNGSYFLANETEESSKRGLLSLKEEIFSKLTGSDVKLDTPNSMPKNIDRLKIFVVLDDVSDPDHMKELLGNPEDFESGSRIIITTRNEQVLMTNDAKTYKLTQLSFDESLDLFNLNAFKKSDKPDEYHELSERVVRYAQGIPLVLKVLAGHLRGNTKEVWESELGKIDKEPHGKVYDVMIRSYHDLQRKQKQIFRDLACFILKSHHGINVSDLELLLRDDEKDNSVVADLERLKNKALITFSEDNFVSMHDVLEEMALEIVRRESIGGHGRDRWLWDPNDIIEALKNDKVIEAIRSLRLPLSEMKEHNLIPQIFSKMSNLQFLHVSDGEYRHMRTLAEGLQFLSSELRILDFEYYPLKYLPEHFSVEKIVILSLQDGNMENLWDDVKNLVNLRKLDFSGSEMLKKLPDLSKATNLAVLLLCGCHMLGSVHPSIFSLSKLEKLDLRDCRSLTKLATDSHLCKLNYLNLDSCYNLTEFSVISKNMKELRLCWTKVKALPLLFEHQSKLELLYLCGSAIEKLPSSISNITKLLHVDLSFCKKLKTLPGHLPYCETLNVRGCISLETLPKLPLSLKTLNVSDCKSLQTLPELPPSHETLHVYNCSALATLPELPQSLKTLEAKFCKSLQTLPELPPSLETLNVSRCISLETLPKLPLSLKTITAWNCKSLQTLPELPPSLETLNVNACIPLETLPKLPLSLKTINVSDCKSLQTLPELPSSLETLYVSRCISLETLPKLPLSLKTINVRSCKSLQTLPELPPSLETLNVRCCYALATLPELPRSLKTLYANFCKSVQTLPKLPPSLETLDASGCGSLVTVMMFPSAAVEQLKENRKRVLFLNCFNLDEHSQVAIEFNAQINAMKFANRHLSSKRHYDINNQAIYMYPGSNVPEWFENKTRKDYIIIDLSSAPPSTSWGFILCLVFGNHENLTGLEFNLIISDDDGEGKKYSVRIDTDYVYGGEIESDHVCVMYDERCSGILNRRAKNQKRFKIKVTSLLQLKGFGVSPILSGLRLAVKVDYVICWSKDLMEDYHEPTHVRHQSSDSYKNAFAEHARKYQTKVQTRREALNKSADLSGIESSKFQNDAELLKEIVNLVLSRLAGPLANSKGLVGIEEKIAEVELLIRKEPEDTCLIGIWGMGGIGKTTLAEEVFNKLQSEYEASYFFANEREQSSKHGIISVKEKLFSELLGYDVKIHTPNSLPGDVVRTIGCMKVLIVLDDVNDSDHFEILLGTLNNFGSGSRIIITTRDEQVLNANNANEIYCLGEFSSNKALELFNLNAFNRSDQQRDAKGIPLVLKVLAHGLRGKNKEVWKSELDKLKQRPPTKVYDVMKLSYDDLNPREQQIFLDLACFFLRSHITVNLGNLKFLLKDSESDNSVVAELERLKDKALITLSEDNFVSIHDSLQEMAGEIVHLKDPGSHCWLWDPNDDIYEALKTDKGIEAIRSLRIHLPTFKKQKLSPDIFAKMNRLQFLEISGLDGFDFFDQHNDLARGLQSLATKLRFLCWSDYPLKSLPKNFSVEKLVILKLQYGRMKTLWDGVKNLVNLKEVDLSHSSELEKLPNLSKAKNLEVLILRRCSKLTSVHQSIFSLDKLEKLDLWNCQSLAKLTSDFDLCNLSSLNLGLCKNLKYFSVISENMKELRLGWTKVKALPWSFGHQTKLNLLDLSCSEELQTIPELPPSLESLNVRSCKSLKTLPELPPSLKNLDVGYCESLQTLPKLPTCLENLDVQSCTLQTLPKLPPFLKILIVRDSKSLQSLPELPQSLEHLNAMCCKSLQILPKLPPFLKTLYVESCESLQTLPELMPFLETVNARSCESLKTVLFPSTSVEKLKENRKRVEFWNCCDLDEHSLVATELNAQINVMKFASQNLPTPDNDHVVNFQRYRYYPDPYQVVYGYPGSKVPEWLEYKTTEDYLIIDFSSAPSFSSLGFIFCFVFGKDREFINYLLVTILISDCEGKGKMETVNMSIHFLGYKIESDNVCVV